LVNTGAAEKGIFIYPNPVQDELILETGDHPICSVSLIDMDGRIVYHQYAEPGNEHQKTYIIDTQNLHQGIYIIKIYGETLSYTGRITVGN
jgi:hypothetical protein